MANKFTAFPNGVSSFGIPIMGGQGLTMPGTAYFVDSVNGSDGNVGKSLDKPLKTIEKAYSVTKSGNNDVIYVVGNGTAYPLAAAVTWSNTFTHMVGLTAPIPHGNRARITMGADMTSLLTVSGQGNIFSNFQLQHGRGTNTNLDNVIVSSNRNYFCNVGMNGPLNATEGAAAYNELTLASGAQDNMFESCTIGEWSTAVSATNGYEIEFKGNNAQTYFKDCMVMTYASDTGHDLVAAAVNLGGEAALVRFEGCTFANMDNDKTLTAAITEPTHGIILLKDCAAYNITDWSDTSNAHVYVTMAAANEAGGIGVVPS
jgi:hypothetical protein